MRKHLLLYTISINRVIRFATVGILLIFVNSCSKDDGGGSDNVIVVKTPT